MGCSLNVRKELQAPSKRSALVAFEDLNVAGGDLLEDAPTGQSSTKTVGLARHDSPHENR